MSESELRQEIEQLRAEIDRVDDWANGLFAALVEVLPLLLKQHPEVIVKLEPMWRSAAERFDAMQEGHPLPDADEETAEQLEPRKMMYRLFSILGVWGKP